VGPNQTSTRRSSGAKTGEHTHTPPPTAIGTIGEGSWTVGEQIVLGRYAAPGDPSGCYWERVSGFSGELDDILANDFTTQPVIVDIAPTDEGFTNSGCGTFTPSN